MISMEVAAEKENRSRNVSRLTNKFCKARVMRDDQNWLRRDFEEEMIAEDDEDQAKFYAQVSEGGHQIADTRTGEMRASNRLKMSPKGLLVLSNHALESRQESNSASQLAVSENEASPKNMYPSQHDHHRHQHQHHHRLHSAACMASKQFNEQKAENNLTTPASQFRMVRKHLPHCVHNKCLKHQDQQNVGPKSDDHLVADEGLRVRTRDLAAAPAANTLEKNLPSRLGHFRYLKHANKYLLVEYEPSQTEPGHPLRARSITGNNLLKKHPVRNKRATNPSNRVHASDKLEHLEGRRRSTVNFVSQLYFLLHLSVILSLLLHHRNLLFSERKLLARQLHLNNHQAPTGTYPSTGKHQTRKYTMGEQVVVSADPATPGSAPTVNHLPQPQRLVVPARQVPLNVTTKRHSSVVNSVLTTSSSGSSRRPQASSQEVERSARRRFGRQADAALNAKAGSSDILVELVGYSHARYALQYLLCYLLASSVAMLLWIRLCRMCVRRRPAKSDRKQRNSNSNYGFYYRTRLDCTPVLIGSISLGLIQLIVIGLEVANRLEWLNTEGRRWPIYLPALQFAFVSLLMQFILSKVAKNRRKLESAQSLSEEKICSLAARRRRRSKTFSISKQEERIQVDGRQTEFPSNNRSRRDEQKDSTAKRSSGFQNIALAHLLVTHILLWLMKLNSISLFQATEQPAFAMFDPSLLLLNSNNNNNLVAFERDSSHNDTNSQISTSDTSFEPDFAIDEPNFNNRSNQSESELQPGEHYPTNRTELEGILRRKSPTNLVSSGAPTSNETISPSGSNQSRQSSNLPKRTELRLNATTSIQVVADGKSNAAREDGARTTPTTSLPPTSKEASSTESDSAATTTTKNERGLRSTGVKAGLVERANATAEAKGALADNTTISLSHSQLMRLLSMAATGQTQMSPSGRFQLNSNTTSSGPPIVQPNNIFKSSLPKRMTAFRQNSTPAGKSLSSSTESSRIVPTIPPPIVTTTEMRPPPSTTAAPKQRARIIITHEPGPASRRPPASVDPHFPSVEPTSGRDKEADREGSSRTKLASGLEKPILVVKGPAVIEGNGTKPITQVIKPNKTPLSPPPAIVENEVDSDLEEEERPDGESSDEDDFQLPPVPNYNETNQEEEEEEGASTARPLGELSITRKPRLLAARPEPEEKVGSVFNEAASNVAASVTKAPSKDPASLPKPEAQLLLTRRQNVLAPSGYEPSFTDYLLPIVHQYYILVIAILFNMWLDSLQAERKVVEHYETRERTLSAGQLSGGGQERHKYMSKSVNSLHRLSEESDSTESTPSRYNSLRSWSSKRQLLWIPSSRQAKQQVGPGTLHRWEMPPFTSMVSLQRNSADELLQLSEPDQPECAANQPASSEHSVRHPICSVIFGLLVVSASLIVMMLGVDLLSMVAQCMAQFIAILVCLLGLYLIWRERSRRRGSARRRLTSAALDSSRRGHRQCFHYLFLLAAYYCGISIGLNLTRQYSVRLLFSQQVIHFWQRYSNLANNQSTPMSAITANILLLFHLLLALKGFLLILQVTLQTVLIRSSCLKATRDLRQVYTFLMFANLSLWVMEICEQQQHLQRVHVDLDSFDSKLMTMDSFTKFAASIVTLSHLYHGLVFMQR